MSPDKVLRWTPEVVGGGKGCTFHSNLFLSSSEVTGHADAHRGKVRRLPGCHPHRDERAMVKSELKNASTRNTV